MGEMINYPAFITENEKKLASDYVKVREKLLVCEQTSKKDDSYAKIENKGTTKNDKKETGTNSHMSNLSKPRNVVKKISLSDFKFDSSDIVVRQVSGGFEVEKIGSSRDSTLVIANKVYEYSVEFLSGDENDNYWVTLHRNFFQTYV